MSLKNIYRLWNKYLWEIIFATIVFGVFASDRDPSMTWYYISLSFLLCFAYMYHTKNPVFFGLPKTTVKKSKKTKKRNKKS